jgi:NadR type nicotinamide-nucleotide adenylyltransferase
MTHGVVIGKFYPLHLGHVRLIQFALTQVDLLTIILCSKPDQKPTGELRESWLRELFPAAQVIRTPDDLPESPEPWAMRTLKFITPTHVISSELYGEPYAAFMNAKNIAYDLDRTKTPISGTQIRNNPYANWEFLPAPVKQFYAYRVLIVGAESTGKTTLCQELAQHFQTNWVPEYGREYTEHLYTGDLIQAGVGEGYQWVTQDFLNIAIEQQRREDQAARTCNRILIGDTNAWATAIWHERYLGFRDPQLDEIGDRAPCNLALLTKIDLPFVQDGIRDGQHIRQWMHDRFLQELASKPFPYHLIFGSGPARVNHAKEAIHRHFPHQGILNQ